jgi:hypothetical protein
MVDRRQRYSVANGLSRRPDQCWLTGYLKKDTIEGIMMQEGCLTAEATTHRGLSIAALLESPISGSDSPLVPCAEIGTAFWDAGPKMYWYLAHTLECDALPISHDDTAVLKARSCLSFPLFLLQIFPCLIYPLLMQTRVA